MCYKQSLGPSGTQSKIALGTKNSWDFMAQPIFLSQSQGNSNEDQKKVKHIYAIIQQLVLKLVFSPSVSIIFKTTKQFDSIYFCLSIMGCLDCLNQEKKKDYSPPTNSNFNKTKYISKAATEQLNKAQTFLSAFKGLSHFCSKKSQVILSTYWKRNAVRTPRNFWLQCS